MPKELPFYNVPIEKPEIKCLNNVDMLHELPFHDEFNIVQVAKAFRKFARSHSIEILKNKDSNTNDLLTQL